MKVADLVGKTIQSAEAIGAEFGRTYNAYLCLVFTDGERQIMGLLHKNLELYNPKPPLEEMQNAPNFFSPDDIADKMREIEQGKRLAVKKLHERKVAEYEKLRKELRLDSQ